MPINTTTSEDEDLERTKFPFRFLLRWTWPEHIEKQLRQLMWVWLTEAVEQTSDTTESARNSGYLSDYAAMKLLWLIAVHPESPGVVLDFIARQPSHIFVERIAENPSTLASTLEFLSISENPAVRAAVACNRNTSEDIAEELCFDECVDVRYALSECTHRSEEFIERLLEDENPYVVARAKLTKKRLKPTPAVQMPPRLSIESSSTQSERKAR